MIAENNNYKINTTNEMSLKDVIHSIRDWIKYILSKLIFIIILSSFGGVIGFIYAGSKKPIYIATTTFVLEDGNSENGGLGSLAGLASIAGINGTSSGGIFHGDNILELYKSRSMIKKALLSEIILNNQKQLLIERYIKINNLNESWDKFPDTKNLKFSASDLHDPTTISRVKDSILNIIVGDINKNYLRVSKADPALSIIKAEVKSKDELFAKAFNDEIVKNVNDFYVQTKTKKSLDNVAILTRKVDSVRAVMNGAIYISASVADATPNLNPTKQKQRIVPLQRSQFSIEVSKAILSELIKNLEMSKLSAAKDAPLIQVIDGPTYPLNIEKIGKIKGAIIGGFIFGFLTVLFLIVRKFFKNILA